MDGFKDSTKTHYMQGGSCYAKGGSVKGAAKVSKVMGEFKSGKLHSGSKKGPEVTNKKQAVAIALSEARKAGAKVPVKKSVGGRVGGPTVDESGEEAVPGVSQRDDFRKRKGLEVTKTTVKAVPADAQTPLSRRLSEAPRRGPSGAGYRDTPLIGGALGAVRDAVRSVTGLKKGGLAAMPRGKKC